MRAPDSLGTRFRRWLRAQPPQNPADVWAFCTYSIVVAGVIIAYSMSATILSMNKLQIINFDLLQIWREISRNIEFVIGNPTDQIANPALYADIQANLGRLIDAGGQSEIAFRKTLDGSHLLRIVFQFGQNIQDERLRALGAHPELARLAIEMRDAPYAGFSTGFVYWPADVVISIKGERYMAPLLERMRLLDSQSQFLLRLLYIETAALLAIMSACLIAIWLRFLRPAIRHLANTRKELQFVLDNAPAAIFSFSPDGAYISANRNYLEFVGLSDMSQIRGKMISEVLGQGAWQKIQRQIEATRLQSAQKFEVEGETGNGHNQLLVSYEIHQSLSGDIEEIVALVIDITELDQARHAMRLSEERLRITLDSIGDGVISTDVEGRVVEINPKAASLTGWSPDEARNLPLAEVLHIVNAGTYAKAADPVERVLRENAEIGFANETLLLSRDGKEYQIADSGAPIRDRHGRTVGVVLVFRDVTEEYRLRNALRQTEKLQALGLLGGGVAHDFNNLLAGIQGNLDLISISEAAGRDAGLFAQIDEIARLVRRGAGLTDQLMQFAQMKPPRKAPVDLHQLAEECVQLLRRTTDKRIAFEITDQSQSSSVLGDDSVLQAAIMNILLNAVDAIEGAGLVQVEIADMTAEEVREILHERGRADRYVTVRIRDSGKGIADKDLPHVFEPFFTTKEPGKRVGLGLPAAYGTIRNHGGDIKIATMPDAGTVVTLVLPACSLRDAALKVATAPDDTMPRKGELTVLFADDEATLRETARVLLKHANCRVILAENGRDCLDRFRREQDSIDLVIIDLNMPVMSGAEAMAEIVKLAPATRIIVTSGYGRESRAELMSGNGNIRFMKKPYPFSELIKEIKAFMSDPDGRG